MPRQWFWILIGTITWPVSGFAANNTKRLINFPDKDGRFTPGDGGYEANFGTFEHP